MEVLPDEGTATQWFESVVWGGQRCCRKCGSTNTRPVPNAKPMPYWCTDCRGYFSVRTGTAIAKSNVPLRKWAIAIYLCLTSLKRVSSMKLHRDLGVSQKTAWFMLHRIREAWATESGSAVASPVEADETFVGDRAKKKNMHRSSPHGNAEKIAAGRIKAAARAASAPPSSGASTPRRSADSSSVMRPARSSTPTIPYASEGPDRRASIRHYRPGVRARQTLTNRD